MQQVQTTNILLKVLLASFARKKSKHQFKRGSRAELAFNRLQKKQHPALDCPNITNKGHALSLGQLFLLNFPINLLGLTNKNQLQISCESLEQDSGNHRLPPPNQCR